MWLLNTHDGTLKEFIGDAVPAYAILSHRWGDPVQEVSWKDYQKSRKQDTTGYKKIRDFLSIAANLSLDWAWVDTCCIDKKSSAELSEAINSMWGYYAKAKICCVYLADAGNDWQQSVWFERGWTLQELLAPAHVQLYDEHWQLLGTKVDLAADISKRTNLPVDGITGRQSGADTTVAEKMSWAAHRKTTRIEDRAYSLLGLFSINMPLLYGEGPKAFQRLQLAIMEKWPDESIFAWRSDFSIVDPRTLPNPVASIVALLDCRPLLARTPDQFAECSDYKPSLSSWSDASDKSESRSPSRITSWGIEIRATAYKLHPRGVYRSDDTYLWALPLTRSCYGMFINLPHVLILANRGTSPMSYQCCGAVSGYVNDTLKSLKQDFTVGRAETGCLFYLDIDDNWIPD